MPKIAYIFLAICSLSHVLYAQSFPDGKEYKAGREFRAAWVATVANINWPSKPGLTVEQQQSEAIAILDSLQNLNFNAVVFQVRPQGDALYSSALEPWSYFLTGEQGVAPSPFYDPLEYWLDEAHKRAMELHVWLNPYRVHHISAPEPSAESLVHKMKDAVVRLEEGYWWLDPAKQATQTHTLNVVKDILLRYDIDGVHFDDYFYPYDSYNGGKDFPDDDSWSSYQQEGGMLARKDWRRDAVNNFVRNVYYLIKSYKPHVKLGVSPFGIWRPGYPESIEGMDQYDRLYADAKLWLNQGWVDYFSPQLYWPIAQTPQSYPVLLEWWQSENTHQRHLWPGINDYRATKDERGADEIHHQIMINRAIAKQGPGVIHWSVGSVLANDSLMKRLRKNVYADQALVPASPWLVREPILEAPTVKRENFGDHFRLSWTEISDEKALKVIVYTQYGDRWTYKVLDARTKDIQLRESVKDQKLERIEVAYIDRFSREGKRSVIQLNE